LPQRDFYNGTFAHAFFECNSAKFPADVTGEIDGKLQGVGRSAYFGAEIIRAVPAPRCYLCHY
jgi:hypothetical protein